MLNTFRRVQTWIRMLTLLSSVLQTRNQEQGWKSENLSQQHIYCALSNYETHPVLSLTEQTKLTKPPPKKYIHTKSNQIKDFYRVHQHTKKKKKNCSAAHKNVDDDNTHLRIKTNKIKKSNKILLIRKQHNILPYIYIKLTLYTKIKQLTILSEHFQCFYYNNLFNKVLY